MESSGIKNLGSLDQVPPGEGRVFDVDDTQVAVFRDRFGGLFATEPTCPHAGGPLADGLVGCGRIVCPLHDKAFDLTRGKSSNSDFEIKAYQIELNDQQEMLVMLI